VTTDELPPELERVLRSAAELQRLVPDAVLVGGSAAALHAGHRISFDHDHVLPDLAERYEQVLDAVAASQGWATSVRASRPPFTIMGSLDGVEAGLRQLRRTAPLETMAVTLPGGAVVTVPTAEETLRVKAYLVVQRNQVRDYLDVVALADALGDAATGQVLAGLDSYYGDRSGEAEAVSTALVERLSRPAPRDLQVTHELAHYKALDPRWHQWSAVVSACRRLADLLLDGDQPGPAPHPETR
jgi:hypothetical protein